MAEENKQPQKQMPSFNWQTLLWILAAWLIFSYLYNGFVNRQKPIETISYSVFKTEVRNGNVSKVTIRGKEVEGNYRDASRTRENTRTEESRNNTLQNSNQAAARFKTTLPAIDDPELLPLLEKNGVTIVAEKAEQPWLVTMLVSMLPWLLIIGFFIYSSKKLQERMSGGGPGGGIFGFGKSKAKIYQRSEGEIKFSDVAGLENAKKELTEVVAFLKDPQKFTALGGELPHGLLLVGPPGVGKTMLARAAAGEAFVPFFSISGSEFVEMFVGVGASRVRDMFAQAKKEAPSIIFIDEIDSIGRVRGSGLGGGHDEREQTLNQILSEMDGFSKRESVIVMAATNRPDVLDRALIRPGRFDRQVQLDLPQKKARKQILGIHTRQVPLGDDIDLEELAERTVGLSGADLKNLVNEATLIAARTDKSKVEKIDFDSARDKILMGIERDDVIQESEKEVIAYHEAGHALLASLLPNADPLQKVSIIPRGRALGATEQIPEEDRYNYKYSYLTDRMAVMLGGRAAEKTVFQEVSTGAGDDLNRVTDIARRMVCQWGMSEKIGPVTYKTGDQQPFLGRELSESRDFSEATASELDTEIRRLIIDAESKAMDTLAENRKQLDGIAEGLLEHETLHKEEVDKILEKKAS
mgnify:CR=1 FL=1